MKKTYLLLRFLLPAFILLLAMQSRAQYVFTPSRTLINYQNYNSLTYDSIHIANNGTDTLKLKWALLSLDTTGGTYFDFCSSGNCWLGVPAAGSFPPIVPGGWGYAGMHLWTGNTLAMSIARIWVYREGNYAVGDTLSFILFAEHQTAVKNNTAANDIITLYPMPASDKVIISIAFATAADSKISIYNSLGGLVFSKTYPEKTIEIPLAQYKEGLYFVSLESGKQQYIKKLLIAR
ncbi:MAG: T9SS type A sorting domain-containing protein [Bacteroidetes bacterium]|nr:T9SS type A sorting domain-containing protein [Bacteroidota bacterium]